MKPRISPSLPSNPLQSLIQRQWRPQWICTGCQRKQLRQTSSSTSQKPYYITTPIFYVNAAPHIGHMYTMVLSDVLKRWQALKNRPSLLCTGTDEHGMKIQQAAHKAGIPPKEFCDAGADTFKDLAARIGMSHDIFMRTTDQKHKDAVGYAWQMLSDRDFIYESKHEGWYSVSDETFYPKAQVHLVLEPATGRKMMASVETGKEVEWTSERNYHFRLSAFRERLLEFYKSHPEFIVPRRRMEDVVREVQGGLADLSISRPTERLEWGVRVPNDESQTIYVWLDALLNYATAAGYPFTPGQESAGGWPPDLQVIGKDIVRFHCIYWPAFLMALNLPLPKQILTHAHWTLGYKKMAKSTGNVVNPLFALERFGLDAMRWFLIHDGGIVDDASYDNRHIVEKYKKGLQNGLGNLTARIIRGGFSIRHANSWYRGLEPGEFPSSRTFYTPDTGLELLAALQNMATEADDFMTQLLPNKALQSIMSVTYIANRILQEEQPWKARRAVYGNKADHPSMDVTLPFRTTNKREEALHRCVFLVAETLRISGILLQPVIPDSATRLLDKLGVEKENRTWEYATLGADETYGDTVAEYEASPAPLFPRLVIEN